MPHIRFRAVTADHVQSLSQSLTESLAQTMSTSPENFSFELVSTQFFEGGKPISSYPFVEVSWFARSQEVQDQSARLITEQIKKLIPNGDVVVVFHVLQQKSYYENGEHF